MRQLKITPKKTDRDSLSVNFFLKEISGIKMINGDEEAKLAKEIKKGDREAARKLIDANYRFVVSVAKQYQGSGLELADLISEGCKGLIKASEFYDETYGFRFISYAVWKIRASIQQAISKTGRTIRVSENRQNIRKKIVKFKNNYYASNCSDPSIEDISEDLQISIEMVTATMSSTQRIDSISEPEFVGINHDTGLTFEKFPLDNIPSGLFVTDRKLEKESLSIDIERVLVTLTEREACIIRLFFGFGYERAISDAERLRHFSSLYPDGVPLEEIGFLFDLTGERVRQIKDKAVRRMSQESRSKILRKYFEN